MKLCECGCGQPTAPAAWTDKRYGLVKGEPTRFRPGHGGAAVRRHSPEQVSAAFWSRVEKTNGCWYWRGRVNPNGYGKFNASRDTTVGAHRFAYEQAFGPVPDGLQLDHLCRVRNCVNPAHLEAVTGAENLRRRDPLAVNGNSGKTHCIRGHEFTDENTRWHRGQRHCKECQRLRDRRRTRKSGRRSRQKSAD